MPKNCRYCGHGIPKRGAKGGRSHHPGCTRPRYKPALTIKADQLAEAIKQSLELVKPELALRQPDEHVGRKMTNHQSTFRLYFDNAMWILTLRRQCALRKTVSSKC
jgi:hypothetical protein